MNEQTYIKSQVRKSSVPRLSKEVIEKLEIPVPPIDEQLRIIKLLDHFDELCN